MNLGIRCIGIRLFFCLIPLLACLLVSALTAQAQTVNATWNAATDVPVAANGYTASGTINLTLNCALQTGTNLTVVNNTSLNFIQGTFSNLTQGQTVTLNFGGIGYTFVANYYGGTGNDLVLQWASSRLVAWGENNDGQLGNNSTVNSRVPTPVTASGVLSGKIIIAVSAGSEHSLALCSDGTVAAWGDNTYGQLGNNSNTPSNVPVAVTSSGVLSGKTVISVAAGERCSLALCSDGTVAAWGDNFAGELGNGNTNTAYVPVAVSNSAGSALAGKTVVAVAAGQLHCLALCSDGTVAAWGSNNFGQLGNGNGPTNSLPVAVTTTGTPLAGRTAVAIAAGQDHSLALCSDGTVVTWGDNSLGQLGSGNSTSSSVPVAVSASTGSALAGKTVTAISSGDGNCLVLCSDGTMVGWGDDLDGELGNNQTGLINAPVAVVTTGLLSGKKVATMAAGGAHSLALCSDGTLTAWGIDSLGQLGDNSSTNRSVPVGVSTASLGAGERFMLAASGDNAEHSMALIAQPAGPKIAVQQPQGTTLTNGVSVVNFGASPAGVGVPLTFTLLNNGSNPLSISGTSIDGANGSDFAVTTAPASSVAVGSSTTLVVTFTPTAAFDRDAVLHISSNDPYNSPFNVSLTGSSPAVLAATFNSAASVPITAGSYTATGSTVNFTLNFAPATGTNLTVVNNTGLNFIQGAFSNLAQGQPVTLSYQGTNYYFVANYYGGTGNDLVLQWANTRPVQWGTIILGGSSGSFSQNIVPTAVDTSGVLSGKTILTLAAGSSHCVALCSDGSVAAWGDNYYGQLGNGGATQSLTPVAVTSGAMSGKSVIALYAGDYNSIALCSDGTLVEWGNNTRTPDAVNTANSPLAGKTVVAIAASNNIDLALCSDGTLAQWNTGGTPLAVNTAGTALAGETVVAVAVGASQILALCADGTLVTWSLNGTPTAVSTAGTPLAGKTIVAISQGESSSLALCSDGTMATWGTNTSGQLGNGTLTSSSVPVAVTTASTPLAGKTVVAASTAEVSDLALCSDGTLAGWGDNGFSELGNGYISLSNSVLPTLVSTSGLARGEIFMREASGQDGTNAVALVAGPDSPQMVVKQPSGAALTNGVSQVDFGSSAVGSGVPLTFTILNQGKNTLSISSATIDGANSSDFTVTTAPASSVLPGSSTTLVVTFTPSGTIQRSAALHLSSNDPFNSAFNVAVTGTSPGTLAANFTSAASVPLTASGFTATGSTVNLSLNYAPLTGTNLTLVHDTPPGFIQGAFSNLAQGQLVTLTYGEVNYSFVANYFGGSSGHDLVLQWANSRLMTWGENVFNTYPVQQFTAAPQFIGSIPGKTILTFSTGGAHNLILYSDGALEARGSDTHGQLGDGTTNGSDVYVDTSADSALFGKTVVAVSAGAFHSLALCSDGTVAAWGQNSSGQLGNGKTSDSSVPVAVNTSAGSALFGKKVIAISAGGSHSLALCADGTVAAWGDDTHGQLGANTAGVTTTSLPLAVNTTGALRGKTVTALSAGNSHSLVLCSDGTVVSWGDDTSGQLGYTSISFSTNYNPDPMPVDVSAASALFGKTVVSVSAGGSHSVALCSDGTVTAWGEGYFGQLGDNSFTQSNLPVLVDVQAGSALFGKTVTAVSAGLDHTVALCSDGTVAAWGDNHFGELGDGGAEQKSAIPVAVSTSNMQTGEFFVSAVCNDTSEILALVADPVTPLLEAWSEGFSDLTTTSVTLGASIDPGGNSTVVTFDFGTDTTYGTQYTATPSPLTGDSFTSVSAALSGLALNTTYHFRVTATSAAGTLHGADQTFTTLNNVATLSGLTLSSGPLSPAFDPNTLTYSANVSSAVTSITLTPTATDPNAWIYLNGFPAQSGQPSSPVQLVWGGNTVQVLVYATDGSTNNVYTINVTANTPEQDWLLQTFGANANNPTISGDNADPNGNGIPNLMEYALHGDALGNSTGTSILPQVSANPTTGTLQLSFTRYQDRPDITLTVQACDNLNGPWTDLATCFGGGSFFAEANGATVNESGTGNAISVTVGDVYQMTDPNHPQRFMRLVVTRP